jgi:hypothetical protein
MPLPTTNILERVFDRAFLSPLSDVYADEFNDKILDQLRGDFRK